MIKAWRHQPSWRIQMYDMEVDRVAAEIKRRHAKRVLIQLPDGLRPLAFTLAETLERETDAEIILSGQSCYGACDLSITQASTFRVNLIIHYGHSKMIESLDTSVIYVEAKVNFPVQPLVDELLSHIEDWHVVGLTTTVQHVHKLGDVGEALEIAGKRCLVGKSGNATPHDGQVLGCDYTSASSISKDVDGYVFIGAGRFHPLGLAVSTGKPVAIANPYLISAEMLSEREVMTLAKKRMAAITLAKSARKLGIVVSSKPGQYRLEAARTMRTRLVEEGRSAFIIALDEVGTLNLGNFSEVDAFIVTACPRVALDGVPDIPKPILTLLEAQLMLGKEGWENVWGRSYLKQ
jgi:2-(3-amino-3-carboxypropyl)histidine synthase